MSSNWFTKSLINAISSLAHWPTLWSRYNIFSSVIYQTGYPATAFDGYKLTNSIRQLREEQRWRTALQIREMPHPTQGEKVGQIHQCFSARTSPALERRACHITYQGWEGLFWCSTHWIKFGCASIWAKARRRYSRNDVEPMLRSNTAIIDESNDSGSIDKLAGCPIARNFYDTFRPLRTIKNRIFASCSWKFWM